MPRTIRVSTPLPDGTLLFESMTGDEGLSRPFRYEVHLLSSNAELDMSNLLGKPMVVGLDVATGAERQFTGFVTRIALAGTSGPYVRYVVTLRPWMWLLSQEADCRIFQNMTVPEIVKQIFRESGFSDFEESLSGTYRTWDFSVQYRESDFNYVSRLLEQEGIYYFFKHQDGKHTLVLGDSPSAHSSVTGYEDVAYFAPGPDHGDDEDRIHSWSSALQVRPGAFATTDFDFERPKADLSARLDAGTTYPYGDLEIFDYPGEYVSASDGEDAAGQSDKKSSARDKDLRHIADKGGVRAGMRPKGTRWMLGIEEALREIVRDEVRKELRHHREEMLVAVRAHDRPPPKTEPDPDELLTVDQVAPILKVIPDTVRSWIQSGTLRASQPGSGARPGRKYRIRRVDLDAFVASSERLPRSPDIVTASETTGISDGMTDRTH